MKIINKTGKVVGIGSLTLLPDGSGRVVSTSMRMPQR